MGLGERKGARKEDLLWVPPERRELSKCRTLESSLDADGGSVDLAWGRKVSAEQLLGGGGGNLGLESVRSWRC